MKERKKREAKNWHFYARFMSSTEPNTRCSVDMQSTSQRRTFVSAQRRTEWSKNERVDSCVCVSSYFALSVDENKSLFKAVKTNKFANLFTLLSKSKNKSAKCMHISIFTLHSFESILFASLLTRQI